MSEILSPIQLASLLILDPKTARTKMTGAFVIPIGRESRFAIENFEMSLTIMDRHPGAPDPAFAAVTRYATAGMFVSRARLADLPAPRELYGDALVKLEEIIRKLPK